jgi:hypothetical protein
VHGEFANPYADHNSVHLVARQHGFFGSGLELGQVVPVETYVHITAIDTEALKARGAVTDIARMKPRCVR